MRGNRASGSERAERSYHSGGVNVPLGDASVRIVKRGIAGPTWRSLSAVAGGEVVGSDGY